MSKKTAKVKNKTSVWNFASVILVAVFCITLVNQGGFYEGAIAFAGLILSAFLLAKPINLRISVSNGLLLLFSVWYFFCSVKNGFVTEYAVKGLLPFVLFLFSVYAKECGENKEHIITAILKFSLCLAVIAIVQSAVLSIRDDTFIRLLFPFNYSNVSGIYFAVCFFMSIDINDKFLKKTSVIFAVATLLTLSVGAVLLSLLYALFLLVRNKKFKETALLVFLLSVLAFIARERIVQSGGTFLERLLQIHDGFLCMMKNPVFGIGAGTWENAKQIYQTGFYAAKVIHCGPVQLGVDSGFAGILLFFAACVFYLKDAFRNKKKFALALLFFLHSFVDFSLSFTAIGFLLILLSENTETKAITVNKTSKYIAVIIVFCAFAISSFGLSSAKSFEQSSDITKADFFVKHSVNAAKSLALKGEPVPENMFFYGETEPYEIVLNEANHRTDKEKYLVDTLKKQPYNVQLLKFIKENCGTEYIKQAESVYDTAVASLSPIGEILYNLKGVNQ